MRRLLVLFAALALLIAAVVAAPVSAHKTDGYGPQACPDTGSVFIVVFDTGSLGGAADDWCRYQITSGSWYSDPNFSQNNDVGIFTEDIGDHYLMDGYVSSWSLLNTTDMWVTVYMYPDPNFGGIPICRALANDGNTVHSNHDHQTDLPFPYNDTIDSLYVHAGYNYC